MFPIDQDTPRFNRAIFESISDIIRERQLDDNYTAWFDQDTMDFIGDEGRVYIKIYDRSLVIPYIVLKNTRVGTATKLFERLKVIAKELSLTEFKVLGVQSEAMEKFCLKQGFSLDGKLCCNNYAYYLN